MSLVVMKFGGTSVEDPAAIGRTAEIVAGRVALGKTPVVIVSAMARVTDQLLRAAKCAASGDRTICTCFGVSLRTLSAAIAGRRLTTVAEIGSALRAGTRGLAGM